MSIIYTLKKIVDPVTARQEEAERQAKREQPTREAEGEPPTFVCRVCGLRASARAYCPTCLADTMVPAPREPGPTEPAPSEPASSEPAPVPEHE